MPHDSTPEPAAPKPAGLALIAHAPDGRLLDPEDLGDANTIYRLIVVERESAIDSILATERRKGRPMTHAEATMKVDQMILDQTAAGITVSRGDTDL